MLIWCSPINFTPTTLNFDISHYFCTKDEQSKKSNYLWKYRRFAFWIFWIILPLKYPLSVKTTDFDPISLNFNIANYLCTKDERSKNHIILENIADTSFESLGLNHPQNIRYPQKPSILPQRPSVSTYLIILLVLRTSGIKSRTSSGNIAVTCFESLWLYHSQLTTFNFDESYYSRTTDEQSNKSNYLGKYRRYAFWIFGIISPPKCPVCAETTNLPQRRLISSRSYYSRTTDEQSDKSNYLGKYRRYAFWIFGIISPLKSALSVETTNFSPTILNFDIPHYFCKKDERSKKSNYVGKYRRYAFWIFETILPLKYPLSVKPTDFAPTSLNFSIANY